MSERDMELVKACRGVDNVISAGMSANAINNPQEMATLFQDGMIAVKAMVNQQNHPTVDFNLQMAPSQPEQAPKIPIN